MAITPQAGYKIDPNNPNGVVPIDYVAPVTNTAPLPGIQYQPNTTTPGGGGTAPISVSGLQTPQTPINVQTPSIQSPYNVSGLSTDLAPTVQETAGSDLTKRLQALNEGLLGKSAFRATKETEAGLPELQKTQTDLSSRLKALQNEALAIPIQLQQEATGRGVTSGGLRPIETAALRNNAIQALGVSSLLEASRGNITLAQDLVERAVAQKYDPIKEEIAVNKANLDLILNDPLTSLADKNRANRQKEIQDAKAREIAKQEQDSKDIRNLALTAQKYNAPLDVVQKIQNAKTFDEAQLLAGQYLTDPKAKYELEASRLDNVLKQAQITKTQKETSLLGEPTKEEKKAQKEALQSATTAIPLLEDKIGMIETLKNLPGIKSAVGTIPLLSRSKLSVQDLTGSRQAFAGGVHQLVNKETIDTLVNLKARGGTLGALSDQERILLQSAATKIGDWEEKDKNNVGIGLWNTTEKDFKTELDVIQTLAKRALDKARGSTFSADEQSALDAIYSNDNSALVADPSAYYR